MFRQLVAALVLTVVLALPARAQGHGGLLFRAVATARDTIDLDPITEVHGKEFTALPPGGEDSLSARFRSTIYSPKASYWLYAGGRRVGLVTGQGPSEPACTGLPGIARPASVHPTGWSGLAAADSTLQSPTTRTALTTEDQVRLRTLALRRALGELPAVLPDSLQLTDGWVIEFVDGRRWLVGSYLLDQPVDSLEEAVLSLLIVLQVGGTRIPAPLIWSHLGGESSRQVRQPVDVIDLDHDGVPELVTSTTYYESRDYQIWGLQDGAWVELAASLGPSGC